MGSSVAAVFMTNQKIMQHMHDNLQTCLTNGSIRLLIAPSQDILLF